MNDGLLIYSPVIKKELESFFQSKRLQFRGSKWMEDLLNRLEPYTVAGKLLRSNLLCLSYEMFSGRSPVASVIKASAALEITHSALLIHDDIMDNDDWRRGQPSLHRQYQLFGE